MRDLDRWCGTQDFGISTGLDNTVAMCNTYKARSVAACPRPCVSLASLFPLPALRPAYRHPCLSCGALCAPLPRLPRPSGAARQAIEMVATPAQGTMCYMSPERIRSEAYRSAPSPEAFLSVLLGSRTLSEPLKGSTPLQPHASRLRKAAVS